MKSESIYHTPEPEKSKKFTKNLPSVMRKSFMDVTSVFMEHITLNKRIKFSVQSLGYVNHEETGNTMFPEILSDLKSLEEMKRSMPFVKEIYRRATRLLKETPALFVRAGPKSINAP